MKSECVFINPNYSLDVMIFLFFILSAFLLLYLASKKNKTIFVIFAIILLSVLPGFRDLNVGTDTYNYHWIIYKAYYNTENFFPREPGLFIFVQLLKLLFPMYNYYFFPIAIIINSLVIFTIWNFREKININIAFITYIFFFYLETFNIMRQWIAVSLIFSSFILLQKNKKYYSLIINFIAIMFHNSAIIALTINLFYFLKSSYSIKIRKFNYKNIKVINFIIFLSLTIFGLFILNYSNFLYTLKRTSGIGLVGLFNIVFVIFLLLLNNHGILQINNNDLKYLYLLLVITVFEYPTYLFKLTNRIMLYHSVVKILLFAKIYNSYDEESNTLRKILFLIYFAIHFFLFINKLSYGVNLLPYNPFFS